MEGARPGFAVVMASGGPAVTNVTLSNRFPEHDLGSCYGHAMMRMATTLYGVMYLVTNWA